MTDNLTITKVLDGIAAIDSGWEEWNGITTNEIQFHKNRNIEVRGVTKVLTQNAVASLLKLTRLGNYHGGVGQVSKYIYDNLHDEQMVSSVNQLLHSPANKDVTLNGRANGNTIAGFDKPNRQYYTADQIASPFLMKAVEISQRYGIDVRPVDFSANINGLKLTFLVREFKSAEDYGFGVRLTHPFTGSELTTVSPIIKQGFCDNTIISAFDLNMRNTVGSFARYPMLISSVSGMIDSMQEDVMKLENLHFYPVERDQWIGILKSHKIDLNDGQIATMTHGTRNDNLNTYGWVNGLTYTAHNGQEVKPSQKVAMEAFAGKVIANPESFGLIRYDS